MPTLLVLIFSTFCESSFVSLSVILAVSHTEGTYLFQTTGIDFVLVGEYY